MNQKVNVVDRDGGRHLVEWEPGQSLMEAIRDADLPVLASCGGCCSCATCHVFIDDEDTFQKTGERGNDEIELLEEAGGFRPATSRLSCQVAFARSLDSMTVTLAPED